MRAEVLVGDALEALRPLGPGIAQCCVTSPPYWGLRDYGVAGQIGLEETPEAYVARLVAVFAEVRRVLADDGVCWVNLGDSYSDGGSGANARTRNQCGGLKRGPQGHALRAQSVQRRNDGLKPKDLVGIPWRVAFALQADGWYLRSDIIWAKPNPMPESVRDRPTKAHEYLFLLTKRARYYYDVDSVREPAPRDRPRRRASNFKKAGATPGADGGRVAGHTMRGAPIIEPHPLGRNRRSVWTIATRPYPGAHFAVMPPALVEPCIQAGSRKGDLILDPFSGAGTVGMVARRLQRRYLGIELNPDYAALSRRRIEGDAPLFNREVSA